MHGLPMWPDDVVIGFFEKEVERLGLEPEIIIDGFPRSVYQADWLVGKHASSMYKITALIHIEVAKSVVLDRLAARGRSDDTEEAINARFTEYDKAIVPVMNEFEKHGVPIISVDGAQDPAQVHTAIEKSLAEL
jgi:adenylate kinase